MTADRYAVVVHYRWSDDEPERATVIRSRDGFIWHDMCTTDPDSAEEIAEALTYVAEDRAVRRLAETEALVAQHNADTAGNPQSMAEWSQ